MSTNDATPDTSALNNGIPLKRRLQNILRPEKSTGQSSKLLGEWRATAIAGNDISSSCLYTAGICAQKGTELFSTTLSIAVFPSSWSIFLHLLVLSRICSLSLS